MKSVSYYVRFVLCLLALTVSVRAADPKVDEYLQKVFDEYHERRLLLFPIEATMQGDPRYNDQLTLTPSPDHVAKRKSLAQSTLEKLDKVPAGKPGPANALAAEILRYEVTSQLEGIAFDVERIPTHQFDGLPLTFGQLGSGTSSQPFKTVRDYENWLARTRAYSAWTNAAIEAFRRGSKDGYVLPEILVQRMIKQQLDPSIVSKTASDSLFYGPIRNLPSSFSAAEKERLTKLYEEAITEEVIPAYRRLGEYLRDEYLPTARSTSGIGALKGGDDLYRYLVRYWTTTHLTPDEIFAIGEREVARIEDEMRAVQKQMNIPGTLADYFEVLKTDPKFTPFKSPEEVLAAFHRIQGKLEPNLDKYFLNRPKTAFEIRRTESFREATASAEYMPGSADGSRPGIFYCPIPDATKFNITSGMESLFLHEALPGHHYQVALQQENQQIPTYLRFQWYGAYGEGWALYCESLGRELGLYTEPEQVIGALGDEMHRAIRLVVDTGIHHRGWTREQAIKYMMEHEPISEQGAVAEIERYMAVPGQALSYKIGAIRIRELRTKYESELGDKFDLREFHHEILKDGCMPLSILEKKLERWAASKK